jgi:hypothetical protein
MRREEQSMALWIAIGAGGYFLIFMLVLGLCMVAKSDDIRAEEEYERWVGAGRGVGQPQAA